MLLDVLASATATESIPINIGVRRELFIDNYLISQLSGTHLKLSQPQPAGIIFKFDDLWDGPGSGYATIIKDGPLFRMYYVGLPGKSKDEQTESCVCYAESLDGINWIKPSLGIVEYNGSTQNNILLPPGTTDTYKQNFSPFLDTRPGVPEHERFKAVGGSWPKGLFILVSSDGLHWKPWRDEPVFSGGAFDSQNVAFWSEAEACYVLYFRVFSGVDHTTLEKWAYSGYRTIARTTSSDLITWSPPVRMSFGNTPLEELYTNSTRPYFRAQHIYIAMPMRFVPGRRFLTDEQFAELKVVPAYLNITGFTHNIKNEVSDTVLLTSRGGYRYDRSFMEALVRPGPDAANWISRNGIAATGLVQTGPAEMSFYLAQHFAQPTAHMKRFSVRLDGLGSVNAPYTGGEMVTKPLIVSGTELRLNYATSATGTIRVEIQETDGEPIPGYSLKECDAIVGDSISQTVCWKMGPSLVAIAGKAVRLRFVMNDADLYSLQFQ